MKDLIIIGAGPAGLTAAIYAQRYKLDTLIISQNTGGTANTAPIVENYPGFKSIIGTDLMKKFYEQVEVPIKNEEVISIDKKENFIVETEKSKYESKSIIIATGTKRRKLNLLNEDKFAGKGISYCTICDTQSYKDKTVAVLGGANSAAKAALLLAKYAKKVYIIYRKPKLRAEPIEVSKIENNENIKVIYNANITHLKGDEILSSVILDNGKEIKLDGLFVEFGGLSTAYLTSKLNLKLNEQDFIIVNSKKETNVQGLFAAGDITNTPLRQITTACADGAIAANSVYEYCK